MVLLGWSGTGIGRAPFPPGGREEPAAVSLQRELR